MNFTMPIFSAAMPEIFVLSMAGLILLVMVFLRDRYSSLTYFLVQATLVIAFLLTWMQFQQYTQAIITFSGNYVLDKLALISKLFIFVVSFFAFAYARHYIKERHIASSEYYILGLFAVLGMQVMISAYSFLTIFLGLELNTLPLYAMVAMQRNSRSAVEAAMKYFVMGSLASGLLLYGISLIYGSTGTIEISAVAGHLAESQGTLMMLALVFVLAGIIFKFGAVPFHMWVPDVYAGAPTSVTLFISSAPKIAAFAITMRIFVEALPAMTIHWQHVLIAVSILSMLGGNLLAIAQTNIKRMLAYSSIAHIGYTLLGILVGPNAADGYYSAMFYIVTYVMVAAGAFAVIALLSTHHVELDQLDDYRGLNTRSPWLAFIMLLLMFSMAGVPPTVGFFAKLGLLEALVEAHYVWLAVLALLFAIIGAYYYLRVVMLMYFEEPKSSEVGVPVNLPKGVLAAISLNGFAALALGLFPSGLIDLCRMSMG